MKTKDYRKSMYPDADYAKLTTKFRLAGNELAEAAARVIGTWDGHHRLSIALANWYLMVSRERQYRKGKANAI